MNEVYIIDDDEDLLFLAEASFKRAGFEVRTFGSGRDLFDYIQSCRQKAVPSGQKSSFFILCDYRLPDVNGLEIFNALHGEADLCGFALQTGYSDLDLASDHSDACRVKIFEKPVKMEAVFEFVRRCFGDHQRKVQTGNPAA